ncbi:polysaccharide deacetylase family protein [Bradyrhizobium sp. 21]|uniref:polysaccharide deacetylase family protein n=1 Tax=Bradyrhizobium sp. 21 TaxID=2782666 RepID=UPI001FFA0B3D|nr:polysaccharide deacetylase family protein [Bradyrhizobium sp. 21]MCK1383479.1 polysaccharide deacetylase family protein [Bradyrhizobium sp. 21]
MSLTIVMYHYVRDLARSRYPAIKGRDIQSFRRQMDYLAHHYKVVTAEQVVAAAHGDGVLPENAAWLTFDDGYMDHYQVVFPLLHERGWQGSFFPPARAVANRELLDVNRIHFVLASTSDHQSLVTEIRAFVAAHQGVNGVRTFEDYWTELAHASRLDSEVVIFIKRMLQHALPEDLRHELATRLFKQFVGIDEAAFAHELYMSPDQLRMMIRCGMYVGSHGAAHYFMDRLEPAKQADEIDASLAFLNDLGASTNGWVMCYPYGVYNQTLLELLKERSCAVGVTTKVEVARLGHDHALTLPRLDTNDLPG